MRTLRVRGFSPLLEAYAKSQSGVFDAVDGGAGFGSTSREMLRLLPHGSKVFAFEPFPGNQRFFSEADFGAGINLVPKALSSSSGVRRLRVRSVVTADSVWGQKGMEGYSSLGTIVDGPDLDFDVEVESVRGDQELIGENRIKFIKLDLQGSELEALQGLEGFLDNQVDLMFIEYMGQKGLLDFLRGGSWEVFDTEYMFSGAQPPESSAAFEVTRTGVPLSNGNYAWFGYRLDEWADFESNFLACRRDLKMIQTDLVVVRTGHSDWLSGWLIR